MPTNPTLQRRNPAAVKQHTPFAIDSTEFLLALAFTTAEPPTKCGGRAGSQILAAPPLPPRRLCAFCSRRACLPD